MHDLARLVVLAAACFCASRLGHVLTALDPHVSLLYLGPGVGIAALVLYGLRLAPGVALGAFAYHLLAGMALAPALAAAVGEGAAVMLGALLIKRVAAVTPTLGRLRDVLWVAGAGLVAAAIATAVTVVALNASGAIAAERMLAAGAVRWAAAAQGVLLATPLLLTWVPRHRFDRATLLALALGVGLAVMTLAGPRLLGARIGFDVAREVVAFAIFPIAIVFASRLAPREVALVNALIGAALMLAPLFGSNSYGEQTVAATLAALHGFLGFLTLATLAFSAIGADRRVAAGQLAASEARFRSLTEMGNDGDWEQDAELRFTHVSPGVAATGFDAQALLGRTLGELEFDVAPQFLFSHEKVVGAHRPFRDFQLKRTMPNGETRFFLVSGDPVFGDGDRFEGYRGVGREITAEKWAEEALRDSEQRYSSMFHNSPAAIIEFALGEDGVYRFDSCNHSGEVLLGSRAYALIGHEIATSLPGAVARELVARLDASVRADARMTEECDLEFPAGSRRVVLTIVPIRRAPGRIDRVQVNAIDLTEKLRADERARESELLFTRVFNGSPLAMSFARLRDGRITEVNRAYQQLFGLAREQAIGHTNVELGLIVDPKARDGAMARLRAGQSIRERDVTMRAADGTLRHLLYSSEVMTLQGEPTVVTGYIDVTERHNAEDALRRSEESFSKVFHSSPVAMAIQSRPGFKFLEVNDAWVRTFGHSREEAIGRTSLDLGTWGEPEHLSQAWERFQRDGFVRNAERRMRRKSGEIIETLNSAELVTIGREEAVIVSFIDITERKKSERELRRSERRFRDIAETAGGFFLWEVDAEDRLTMVSMRVEQVLGYREEEILGRRFEDLMPPGEAERVAAWRRAHGMDGGAFRNLECRMTTRQGTTVWLQMNGVITMGESREAIGLRGTALDITERKRAEQRIQDLATRDPLTGLPNRLLLQDRLQQGIANAERAAESLAVLFIDLDHFKRVNDTLGHHVGDGLLKEVARRLSTVIRKGDTLSRLGGDEFVIVLEAIKSSVDAGQVAQKILNSLGEAYELDGHILNTAASVGIAVFPSDGTDVATLMRHADTAMYAAKSGGRRTYQFFAAEMNQRATERARTETELRRAVDRGELRVFFQPRVATASGEITAVEALLRWRHPTDGLVGPERFIQVADETGVLAGIGDWVLDSAISQAKAWGLAGAQPIRVGVNVSQRQFTPGLIDAVRHALARHGLSADRLEIELAESTLMRNLDDSQAIVGRLREMGCRVLVDDFGTGYSSMRYLRLLEIDGLKIDHSSVKDIVSCAADRAIVAAIVDIARRLGLSVVAEGVESAEQLAILRELGCAEYLGNLFLPPLSAAELERHLPQGAKIATLAAHRAAS